MFGSFRYFLYLCNMKIRVKAAAQQSSSKLGSAFTLHFTCSVIKSDYRMREAATRCSWSHLVVQYHKTL